MKRTFYLSLLFLITGFTVSAQSYMNEWIDYSKRYYKIHIGSKGLYRISKEQLDAIGLGSTDAAQFQMWKNGEEVSLFTSSASGPLNSGGFIEFWGAGNDGKWESRF